MSIPSILLASLVLFSFPACTGGSGDGSGGGGGGGGGGGNGGGSGVSASKQMIDLSPDEIMDFCAWSIDQQGGEGVETDCGDGVTTSSGTVAGCTSSFSELVACDLTVGQTEDCIDAIVADACGGLQTPACAPLLSCVAGG